VSGKWLRAREVRILRDSARRAKCKKPSQVTGAALLSGPGEEGTRVFKRGGIVLRESVEVKYPMIERFRDGPPMTCGDAHAFPVAIPCLHPALADRGDRGSRA
jgi:hypothetical protein